MGLLPVLYHGGMGRTWHGTVAGKSRPRDMVELDLSTLHRVHTVDRGREY